MSEKVINCPACNTENSAKNKVCNQCGYLFDESLGVNISVGPEPQPEPQPEPEPLPDAGLDESITKIKPELQPEPQPEPSTDAGLDESIIKIKPEPQPEPEIQPQQPQPELQPELQPEPEPEPLSQQDVFIPANPKKPLDRKLLLIIVCVVIVVAVVLIIVINTNNTTNAQRSADPVDTAAEPPVTAEDTDEDTDLDIETPFSYSEGIDENGFWENIRALDYVEMFNYKAMQIPEEVHQITEDEIQMVIDNILDSYSVSKQVTDRPVADGDTVNIDYVGSIDGVEFSGGSTEGMGTEVTIGVTAYIDDFLEQLIGAIPGETVNVEVTFPDVYQDADLQSKEALFVTTINYIIENELPVLSDEFVETNLYTDFGWKTIAEMKEYIEGELRNIAVQNYINDYLTSEVTVLSVPDQLIRYQERAMLFDYQSNAEYYGMELDEFLSAYANISGVEELIDLGRENNRQNAIYSLVVQAVAEDMGLLISEEDLMNYFSEYIEISAYQTYVEQLGMPFLKQVVVHERVIKYIFENAVMV